MTLAELKTKVDEAVESGFASSDVMVDGDAIRLASWTEGESAYAPVDDWEKFPHWQAGDFIANLSLPIDGPDDE